MEFTKLQQDMIQAMKDHNKDRKEAISALVAAAKSLAIDAGCRDNIPEEMVNQAIMKELKSVREQVETCPKERTELMAEYKARLAVIEEYAPKMMSAEEIEKFLSEKFADVISTKNKGLIMKSIMPELKGKADGKLINEIVAKICG